MSWYALFVGTGKEELVKTMIEKYLENRKMTAIVPKRKLYERKRGITYVVYRTLFPGYVLLRTSMDPEIYYELKSIPLYCKLLNNDCTYNAEQGGPYLFTNIEVEEISSVLQLIGTDETIDFSTIYIENNKVKVLEGPLKGKEDIIKKVDKRKKRAKIILRILGNEIRLDVGIEILTTTEVEHLKIKA
ncbi:antiterminator LoaP [Bacillus wiedmannii]|uniref:antiterminator LoaP n=1 Tax=Bacillus wiedmannii TaxID=1890302 RepID=UPI000BF02DEF|nr:antiterminator LoaP [Bacillus wiedmannii]PEM20849.1 transcription antiterminator [Bacillus wiedmannii]